MPACPKCGGNMGRPLPNEGQCFGDAKYLCAHHPDCEGQLEVKLRPAPCPKCGKTMLIKGQIGEKGLSYRCVDYPKCPGAHRVSSKWTRCQNCGNDMVYRFSDEAKYFLGCSSYPDCDGVKSFPEVFVLTDRVGEGAGTAGKPPPRKHSRKGPAPSKDYQHGPQSWVDKFDDCGNKKNQGATPGHRTYRGNEPLTPGSKGLVMCSIIRLFSLQRPSLCAR